MWGYIQAIWKFLKTRDTKTKIFLGMASVIILLGLYGFYISESTKGAADVANHTLGLFVFSWTNDNNDYIDFAQFLAFVTIFLGVVIVFFRNIHNEFRIIKIQKSNYRLVIGLSEENIKLLNQDQKTQQVLIIEKNHTHQAIERFKDSTLGVMTGDISKHIESINLEKMKHAIVSVGNDRENIAITKSLLERSNPSTEQTVHTQIINRDLNALFRQNIITAQERGKFKDINIVTYSPYENMAKLLFREHSIVGDQCRIVEGSENYSVVVVGSSPLAVEIIYHIALIFHLPNQNHLTLYCIDKDAQKFCSRIEMLFSGIADIPHLTIEPVELDYEGIEFYRDSVWHSSNLSNIYVATEDEEQNLDIAINLQDTTYVRDIAYGDFHTKVLFAIYHNLGMSQKIDHNKEAFANFYAFANIADIATNEVMIDDDLDSLAQLIHYDYDGKKGESKKRMHDAWLELTPHHRDSNKAQALHIDTKLLSLGLQKVKSQNSTESLKVTNQKIYYERLGGGDTLGDEIESYSPQKFPIDFDTTILDKLARAEHNRWCAFHYLGGWSYNKKREDKAKEHNCLIPLDQFDTNKLKETYKYDLLSAYYIPIYLAKCEYEVLEYNGSKLNFCKCSTCNEKYMFGSCEG